MKRVILISFFFGLNASFLFAQTNENKSQIAFRNNHATPDDWQPMIVVDDVVYSDSNSALAKKSLSNRLTDIDPANVESIRVLKSDSAIAVYGDKAKYGVVIITTKMVQPWQKSKTENQIPKIQLKY